MLFQLRSRCLAFKERIISANSFLKASRCPIFISNQNSSLYSLSSTNCLEYVIIFVPFSGTFLGSKRY